MELWQFAVLSAVGVIAGWLNVMAGGGSLLTVPAMVLMGVPGPVANGTNRIAILAQNVVAVSTFARRGFHEFRLGLSLAAAATVGAVGGALVGVRLEGAWFNRVVALVMIGVMVLMATGGGRKPVSLEAGQPPKRLITGHLLMVGAGVWGGFIHIGVGFILMPILHRVMGLDLVRTNALKVFIVLVYSVAALAVYATQLKLLWLAGLALALGNATGGWLGAHTSVTHGERWIRRVLYVALSALVIRLLLF